jgi:hypothetical protein
VQAVVSDVCINENSKTRSPPHIDKEPITMLALYRFKIKKETEDIKMDMQDKAKQLKEMHLRKYRNFIKIFMIVSLNPDSMTCKHYL